MSPVAWQAMDACAFAHRAAHDLQAPLLRIRSFAGIVGDGLEAGLDERDRRCLEIVTRASREASTLVDRLLALALALHSPLARRAVDVRTSIDEALAGLSTELARTAAVVDPGESASVDADPALFGALLAELLANAVAFREPGRPPRIAFRVDVGEAGAPACLRVRDNGRGVGAAHAGAAPGPFDAGTDADGASGAGLGLALCRIICERHGWTLELHELDEGTEARVRLG